MGYDAGMEKCEVTGVSLPQSSMCDISMLNATKSIQCKKYYHFFLCMFDNMLA